MKVLPKELLEAYHKRNILVTGAGGFVGSSLIKALSEVDCTLYRLARGSLEPVSGKAQVQDRAGDIEKPDTWCDIIPKIDTVFHFAAQTSTYVAAENPLADMRVNVGGMIHLLEALRKAGTKPTILFSGTVTQVGMPEDLPVDESFPDVPVTLYDLSKLTEERYLKYYCGEEWIRGACLRLSNVYGPTRVSSKEDRGILNKIVRMALAEEPLSVFDGGKFMRDYIFIDDVVAAFLYAGANAEKINGRHFVISSGKGVTLKEAFQTAVDQVTRKTGKKMTIADRDRPPGFSLIETRNFVGNPSAFIEATGWQPRFSLEEGLSCTVDSIAAAD